MTAKLIVLAAFNRNVDGDLIPAFEPRQIETEKRAVRVAKLLAGNYDGVVAWSREANPALGEYGPSKVLFQTGELPYSCISEEVDQLETNGQHFDIH